MHTIYVYRNAVDSSSTTKAVILLCVLHCVRCTLRLDTTEAPYPRYNDYQGNFA